MTNLQRASTAEVLAAVLAGSDGHREVYSTLEAASIAAWSAVDAELMAICRERVAQMLDCPSETQGGVALAGDETRLGDGQYEAIAAWRKSTMFDDRQRACLAFTEQFVFDVASLDEHTVSAVSYALGHDGLLAFVSALLVVEQRIRLRLVWEQLGLNGEVAA
jgi:alkylhydroperoxidase family enzyme